MASPLNYEQLYDLLRREKTSPELQNLDADFLQDLREYLLARLTHMKEQAVKPSVFSTQESQIAERQLENIKKVIRELFERREAKILNLALSSSRTKAKYETSALLKEEEKLFEAIRTALDHTHNTMFSLINQEEKPKEIKTDSLKQIKFLNPTPQFLGKDLKTYGPFEQSQLAALPEDLATLLINNNRAEEA